MVWGSLGAKEPNGLGVSYQALSASVLALSGSGTFFCVGVFVALESELYADRKQESWLPDVALLAR